MTTKPVRDKSDYWACACVRRRKGKLTQIKTNHPDLKRCTKCGCDKPEPTQ